MSRAADHSTAVAQEASETLERLQESMELLAQLTQHVGTIKGDTDDFSTKAKGYLERRKANRIPVVGHSVGVTCEGKEMLAEVRNISETGIGVIVRTDAEVGTPATISFSGGDDLTGTLVNQDLDLGYIGIAFDADQKEGVQLSAVLRRQFPSVFLEKSIDIDDPQTDETEVPDVEMRLAA